MARELMLVATVIVCVVPGIHGIFVGVSRIGCGETKLCIETPADCDPIPDVDCLFTSIIHKNSTSPASLEVALTGMSTGYVAMGLTGRPTEMVMLFACGKNSAQNGEFFFSTVTTDSEGKMTPAEMNVNNVRGSVDGNIIVCQFNIPLEGEEMISMTSKLHVLLGTGTTDGKSLGAVKKALDSGLLDATNPASA